MWLKPNGEVKIKPLAKAERKLKWKLFVRRGFVLMCGNDTVCCRSIPKGAMQYAECYTPNFTFLSI